MLEVLLILNKKLTGWRSIYPEDLTVNADVDVDLLLYVEGNLSVSGAVFIKKNLHVNGDVVIRGDLKVQDALITGSLTVTGDIISDGVVITGKKITAQTISAKKIETNEDIEANWVWSSQFHVVCTELKTKTMPLGRNYWATVPALKKWSGIIANEENCWNKLKEVALKEPDKRHLEYVDLGHWILNTQFRNFAGISTKGLKPKQTFCGVPRMSTDYVPQVRLKNTVEGASDALYKIIIDKTKTPYIDYSNNLSYQQIVKNWGSDIRAAYNDANVNLGSLKTCILGSVVEDQTVKHQLVNEIGSVQNVRQLINNHHTFISDIFIDNGQRLHTVGSLSQISDDSSLLFEILGMYVSVIGLINGIAGGIGGTLLAVLSLMKGAGKTNPITAKYNQMQEQLTANFEEALTTNGQMADTIIGDYGKLLKVDTLIRKGQLAWSDAQYAKAVATASNEYERKLWVTILPIYWWPTFSYFYWDSPKSKKCGNTVYMPYWSECSWGHINSQMNYIPYWLTCGGLKWWCNGIEGIADRLSQIGVSMGEIIRGDGDWDAPYATYRKHPVGQDQQPSCVKHS